MRKYIWFRKMKNRLKNMLLERTVIFIAIVILIMSCTSGKKIDKKQFEKIEIGMKISEVKQILGEPDLIKHSDIDFSENYFYLTENDALNKKYASVYFDKSGYVHFLAFANPS